MPIPIGAIAGAVGRAAGSIRAAIASRGARQAAGAVVPIAGRALRVGAGIAAPVAAGYFGGQLARPGGAFGGRRRRGRGITAAELRGARKVAGLVRMYGMKPKSGRIYARKRKVC